MILHGRTISGWVGAVFTSIVLFSCALTAAADNPSGNLTLTFGPGEVTIAGIEGGHHVIAFGIGIGTHAGSPLLTREARALTDDDGDGKVTLTVSKLPPQSVWVCVDAATGDYAVATPTGVVPSALDIPDGSWRGSRAHVDVGRRYLEVLVVRPRVGGWTLRLAEGGSIDGDGVNNGVSRLRLDRMDILTGEEKGPAFVIPKDLIVMIDPQTLDTFVSEAR